MKQKKSVLILKTLIVAAALFFGTQTFAQQDSTATKKLTDKMKTELSLTGEQYNQVYTVNQNFIDQMRALQASGGRRFAKFKKMKAIGDDRDKQMKQILTTGQYQVFEKNKAANKEKMKEAYRSKKGN